MGGYGGNVQLLFKGLDTQGTGRLLRRDFDYLQSISPALRHQQYDSVAVRNLRGRVQEVFGGTAGDMRYGTEAFLQELGLVGEDATSSTIAVRTLAFGLIDLGLPGDEALDCAVAAARDCGGNEASAESLSALLTKQRGPSPPRSVSSSTPALEIKHRTAFRRADWVFTPSITDSVNVERPPSMRIYFST